MLPGSSKAPDAGRTTARLHAADAACPRVSLRLRRAAPWALGTLVCIGVIGAVASLWLLREPARADAALLLPSGQASEVPTLLDLVSLPESSRTPTCRASAGTSGSRIIRLSCRASTPELAMAATRARSEALARRAVALGLADAQGPVVVGFEEIRHDKRFAGLALAVSALAIFVGVLLLARHRLDPLLLDARGLESRLGIRVLAAGIPERGTAAVWDGLPRMRGRG